MNLRRARFEKGFTQYDIKQLTGINPSRISLAERGYIELKKSECEAIAKALGMPVESIDFQLSLAECAR